MSVRVGLIAKTRERIGPARTDKSGGR
jgi:hypothetical protein